MRLGEELVSPRRRRQADIFVIPSLFSGLLYLVETWSGGEQFSSKYPAFYEVTCASCRSTASSASGQTGTFTVWGRQTCPTGTNTICTYLWLFKETGFGEETEE